MSSLTYRAVKSGMIVLPEGEPIFSEMATHIGMEDEGAGAYVTVKQPNGRAGREGVAFDAVEWPVIRQAIEAMQAVSQGLEAETLPEPPQ